jgi:hypothetical protein
VRYAFSPQDFGVVPPLPLAPDISRSRRRPARSAEETATESLSASFEEGEVEEEELELRETLLESLDEGPEEGEDIDEEAYLLDHEDEEE